MRIDNKGFTLVELIATIVVLSLVMGIASYSITALIRNSKEKDYQIFIKEVNNAVEEYYLECKYSSTDSIECPDLESGYYKITLGDLVKYGYLDANSTNDDDTFTLINPNDGKNISGCEIRYKYSDGKMKIEAVSPSGSCPTSY